MFGFIIFSREWFLLGVGGLLVALLTYVMFVFVNNCMYVMFVNNCIEQQRLRYFDPICQTTGFNLVLALGILIGGPFTLFIVSVTMSILVIILMAILLTVGCSYIRCDPIKQWYQRCLKRMGEPLWRICEK